MTKQCSTARLQKRNLTNLKNTLVTNYRLLKEGELSQETNTCTEKPVKCGIF